MANNKKGEIYTGEPEKEIGVSSRDLYKGKASDYFREIENASLRHAEEDRIKSDVAEVVSKIDSEPSDEELSDAFIVSPNDTDATSLPLHLQARYAPNAFDQSEVSKEETDLLQASGMSEEDLGKLNNAEKRVLAMEEYNASGLFQAEQAASKKVWHKISGLWESDGNPDFNLDNQLALDGFSSEDKENFFKGITTERDYNYVKQGLQKERALKNYYDSLSGVDAFTAFMGKGLAECATFIAESAAGIKTIKSLAAINPTVVGKAVETYKMMMAGIPSATLRGALAGTMVGTLDGYKEYFTKYEFSEEDMLAHIGGWIVCGTAGGLCRDTLKFAKSLFSKAYDFRPIDVRVDEFYETGKQLSAMQKFHKFMDTNPITGTPVARGLWNEHSPTLRKYFSNLCAISENSGGSSQEMWAFAQQSRLNYISEKYFSELEPYAQQIEKETGKSLIRWLDYAIQNNGASHLPFKGGNKINEFAKDLLTLRESITAKSKDYISRVSGGKLHLDMPEIGNDYLAAPFARREALLTADDLLDAYLHAEVPVTVKPVYIPRIRYSLEEVTKREKEFKQILTNGKINEYFQEKVRHVFEVPKDTPITQQLVRDLATSDVEASIKFNQITADVNKYRQSKKLKDIVEGQYKDVTSALGNGGTGKVDYDLLGDLKMRHIRVEDSAISDFFGVSSFENVYLDIDRRLRYFARQRALANVGVEDGTQLRALIDDEMRASLGSVYNDRKVREKVIQPLYKSLELVDGLFTKNMSSMPEWGKTVFGLNMCMYGLLLGSTVVQSLSDGAMMIARFGLNDFVRKISLGLPAVVEKGLREIPAKEMKEILEILPFGISDGTKDYLARILPGIMDLGYGFEYRGDKLIRVGRAMSSTTYKFTGLEFMDTLYKRTTRQNIIAEIRKNPGTHVAGLTSEEFENQLSTKNFSDDVMSYIANKTRAIINRPSIADTPVYAYDPIGRMFYTLKSWSYGYVRNFLRPMLHGDFTTTRVIEGMAWLTIASGVSEYIRGIVRGKPYNLSSEDGFNEWLKNTCTRELDELAGYYTIGTSLVTAFQGRNKQDPVGHILNRNVPMLSFVSNIVKNVSCGLSNLSIGLATGNYPSSTKKSVVKMLDTITGNHFVKRALLNNLIDEEDAADKKRRQPLAVLY